MGFFGPTEAKVDKWVAGRNVKKLIETLHSDDGALQRKAVEGMADIRSSEVMNYCNENAQSPDKNTRWHITQILGMIGTPPAMKILTKVRPPKKT